MRHTRWAGDHYRIDLRQSPDRRQCPGVPSHVPHGSSSRAHVAPKAEK
jgi:hypothetical protein